MILFVVAQHECILAHLLWVAVLTNALALEVFRVVLVRPDRPGVSARAADGFAQSGLRDRGIQCARGQLRVWQRISFRKHQAHAAGMLDVLAAAKLSFVGLAAGPMVKVAFALVGSDTTERITCGVLSDAAERGGIMSLAASQERPGQRQRQQDLAPPHD
ncbi:hypothetical protein THICB3620010 [Thiomonas sp. CB3]|nr:hypothetical protein THICB3620010 [Thiomonas sp. CB3]